MITDEVAVAAWTAHDAQMEKDGFIPPRKHNGRAWKAALEAVAPMLAPDGWQPISTAPKDGTRFIAYDTRGRMLFTMHFDDDEFLTECEQWSGRFNHWMPLPKPPQ